MLLPAVGNQYDDRQGYFAIILVTAILKGGGRMKSEHRSSSWFGILIIVLGVVWLLKNLGILVNLDIGNLIVNYWPVLLVVWGLDLCFCEWKHQRRSGKWLGPYLSGMILVAIGLLILGNNLNIYQLDMKMFWNIFWPVVIILVGWNLLSQTSTSGGMHWAVMSGIELKNRGWKLDNGGFLALMGGINIDITAAEIPEHEVNLNLTALMGGIDIKVPADMVVVCEGMSILGGVKCMHEEAGGLFSVRRMEYSGVPGSNKMLFVRGVAIMGGITVKVEKTI